MGTPTVVIGSNKQILVNGKVDTRLCVISSLWRYFPDCEIKSFPTMKMCALVFDTRELVCNEISRSDGSRGEI
jgi:hypothetical protein